MKKLQIEKNPLYPALKLELFFKIINVLRFLSLIAALFSFFYQNNHLPFSINSPFLEPWPLYFSLFLIFHLLFSFYEKKLKGEKKTKKGLVQLLSFKALKVVYRAQRRFKNPNPNQLLLTLLETDKGVNFILYRSLITKSRLKEQTKKELSLKTEKDSEKTLSLAESSMKKRKGERTTTGDLLAALSKTSPALNKYLMDKDLYAEDIENLTWWLENLKRKKPAFWSKKNLSRFVGVGKDWAAGYTIELDKYSTDLRSVFQKGREIKIVDREKELSKIERTLSGKVKNNVLMIGESGVGKKTVIRKFAQKVALGQSTKELNYKRVLDLDLASVVAKAQRKEELNILVKNIFEEASSAGNVILVINHFSQFVAPSEKGGIVDLSGLFLKYLKSPKVKIVGICDHDDYLQKMSQKKGLLNLFERIKVEEFDERNTILALEKVLGFYEKEYDSFVPYPVLRDIVSYSQKFLADEASPQKAINLLEDSLSYLSETKKKVLLPKHLARVVTEKTNIPVGQIETDEKETLLHLEKLMHERIINQEEAVRSIAEALRRSRSGVATKRGPIGTFLFLGPTGVGKTETAKTLAENYFGSEERMIRIDMSEYQERRDLKRLIGDKNEPGTLASKVKQKPFSLILLDEIEKAHPDILNLFLQILDEGFCTDGLGKRINFKNTIIIATSNAGYKIILKSLKEKADTENLKQEIMDYVFEERIFRPEFVNRFDGFIVFKALTHGNLLDISGLMLQKLKYNLKEKYIDFKITEDLKEKIVDLSYKPEFGAREMKRTIQNKVENAFATALLEDKIKKGDTVVLTSDFEIKKVD